MGRVKKFLCLIFKKVGEERIVEHSEAENETLAAIFTGLYHYMKKRGDESIEGVYVVPMVDVAKFGEVLTELQSETNVPWSIEVKDDIIHIKPERNEEEQKALVYVSVKGVDDGKVEKVLKKLNIDYVRVGEGYVIRM